MDYAEFFKMATNGRDPYCFQEDFATDSNLPELVRAPTGSGKTATTILGWLWRRRFHSDTSVRNLTPRRLVYCLPMRVLVEQTCGEAKRWIQRLSSLPAMTSPAPICIYPLLGGDVDDDWVRYPEQDAILVGTQDLLLSRALNRGFAQSPFRWPMDFGLLNSDCLWVLDEVQLMSSGLSTSAQLAAFRRPEQFGVLGNCPTIWMSATLDRNWLQTVDLKNEVAGLNELTPRGKDLEGDSDLGRRLRAMKTLHRAESYLAKGAKAAEQYAASLAKEVLRHHQRGTQTLVILNTVSRARQLYHELTGARSTQQRSQELCPDVLLLHSRFRPPERALLSEKLAEPHQSSEGRIIVATQVVEAGVDMTSRTLFTELAPWASIVQRLGRCNRAAEEKTADVHWVDLQEESLAAPYGNEPSGGVSWMTSVRNWLLILEGHDVSPLALGQFMQSHGVTLPFEHRHVIRRRDMVELFDTSPDLSGNYIDVSRFIREGDDLDVRVFWRDLPEGKNPPDSLDRARRDELCPAPVGDIRSLLKGRREAWRWDYIDGKWLVVAEDDVRAGQTLLFRSSAGGYDWSNEQRGLGWAPEHRSRVEPVTPPRGDKQHAEEAFGDNHSSEAIGWVRLSHHTEDVCRELEAILQGLLPLVAERWQAELRVASRQHDWGKAHCVFQGTMRAVDPPDHAVFWAKSPVRGRGHARRYFRHEWASALGTLKAGHSFLSAYLVASHHGRARLAVRAAPDEQAPTNGGQRYAMGVWDGDTLPPTDLGDGVATQLVTLDLSVIELGLRGADRSWLERALELRDSPTLGPFRLAYLEALLRAADWRASQNPTNVER